VDYDRSAEGGESNGAAGDVDTADAVESADADLDTADTDLDIELLAAIEQELADVELALERLGDGSYGRCETCGGLIGDNELEVAPASRLCRTHLPDGRA
jgi:RNA polymerase-binding transcription factor DksA